MALKDIWKNFVNISEEDLEDGYTEETTEEAEPEVRVKREPVQRRTFERRSNTQTNSGAMKVVIVRGSNF